MTRGGAVRAFPFRIHIVQFKVNQPTTLTLRHAEILGTMRVTGNSWDLAAHNPAGEGKGVNIVNISGEETVGPTRSTSRDAHSSMPLPTAGYAWSAHDGRARGRQG